MALVKYRLIAQCS